MAIIFDWISALIVVLCKLSYKCGTRGYAKEVWVDVGPPLVRCTAPRRYGCIDGKRRSANQCTYPADAGEELRHGILPAGTDKIPEFSHFISYG